MESFRIVWDYKWAISRWPLAIGVHLNHELYIHVFIYNVLYS
jgi:hypothetical protein